MNNNYCDNCGTEVNPYTVHRQVDENGVCIETCKYCGDQREVEIVYHPDGSINKVRL